MVNVVHESNAFLGLRFI